MLKRVSVSPSVVESAAQESPDLLWLNGKDLRRLPLAERKEILRDLVKQPTFFAEHLEATGIELFRVVCEQNLEGIVAKRKDSVYSSAGYWLKIKNPNYTQAEGRLELFGAMRPGPKKAKQRAVLDQKTGT